MPVDIRESESPSHAVKRSIARKEECEPPQLGHLEKTVDVERLDALGDPPIEFRYSGYHVTVTADRTIHTDP